MTDNLFASTASIVRDSHAGHLWRSHYKFVCHDRQGHALVSHTGTMNCTEAPKSRVDSSDKHPGLSDRLAAASLDRVAATAAAPAYEAMQGAAP